MSSFITGGSRAPCRFESLNLDCIIKSPPSSTSWASKNSSPSSSSSPSSTLSESTNSPLAISTRKPRTPRKRPNQTYNEAAALLSTAYPKIFAAKNVTTKPRSKLGKSHESHVDKKSQSLFEPPELINLPFRRTIDGSKFLPNQPPLERFKPCSSPGEINSQARCSSGICCEPQEHFEAGSIVLDDGVAEEGIESIMRTTNVGEEKESAESPKIGNFAYGYPVMGFGLEFGYGMRREFSRAFRGVDDGDWWRFPAVDVADLTPRIQHGGGGKASTVENKAAKKKKKKAENKKLLSDLIKDYNPPSTVKTRNHDNATSANDEKADEAEEDDDVIKPLPNARLLLKLNYDEVLSNWADKASPFSGEEFPGSDVQAKLAHIDLFCENGGGGLIREASVLRYKEKRRTRLFSKKIRYQVRKVNADQRPRMKGRFVRTPNSSEE